jgi:hypothetical protein
MGVPVRKTREAVRRAGRAFVGQDEESRELDTERDR